MNQDFDRIYHFHIRKTGGSSLDSAFWALGGGDLADAAVREGRYGSSVTRDGRTFVQHDRALIAAGDYFFASSHEPSYELDLPPRTLTITILRDPAARVVSYFRYLLWARANPRAHEIEPFVGQVRTESAFLDGPARYFVSRLLPRFPLPHGDFSVDRFPEFLERAPRRRLMSQLHMFSPGFDPAEAAERALGCAEICFTETFSEDLSRIARRLGLPLEEKRERQLGERLELPEEWREELRQRLAPEYAMLDLVNRGLAERRGLQGDRPVAVRNR
ncbi:MAG TPA: hypothetical protein VGG40_08085 [Solirubrobacterales bacterium]